MRPQCSLIHAALLAVAGLVAAGPGSARAADVIKFGVSTPLSGPAAPWGIPHKQATELIFDEINARAVSTWAARSTSSRSSPTTTST